MAISSALKKTTLLLLITTLTISLGASASFNLPTETNHDEDVLVAANDFDFTPDDVELEYEGPDGNTGAVNMTSGDNGNWSYTFNKDDDASGTHGDYVIEAFGYNSSGDDVDSTSEETVTLDSSRPDIVSTPDNDYIPEDAELTFTISDDYTEVVDITAVADDSSILDESRDPNCNPGDECDETFELDTEDLENGDEVSIDLTVEDDVGNINDGNTYDYTYDNEFEGDEDPDLSFENDVGDGVVLMEDSDDDVGVDIDVSEEDETSEVRAFCYVDDEEIETTDFETPDDDETEFDCNIDGDEYGSSTIDFGVEICDEAGNCGDRKTETVDLDADEPILSAIENPKEVSTFNSNFDLELLGSDDASGIEYIEYYFDASTSRESGNEVSFDGSTDVEKKFTVEPDSLDRGNHTAYLRAKDRADRWSEVKEFDFEYYPDRDPDVRLSAQDSIEVTSGETISLELTIENGAPFFLNGVEVSSGSVVWNGTVTATDLEEGDSVEKSITIDASGLDVGTYDMTLSTNSYDATETVEVIVRATEDQKSDIESELQDWENKSSQLQENISEISTLDESNENISSFTNKISNIRSTVDEGRYYEAKSQLQNVESEFDSAQNTYSSAKEQHEKNQRTQLFIFAILGVILLGGGGAAGFLYFRGEDELPDFLPDDWEVDVPDEIPELGVVSKVKELIDKTEEEVEEDTGYSFEGFD